MNQNTIANRPPEIQAANRMAALPGATGLNRDHAPAEQYGQDAYTAQMLKLWGKLDERHRELIRFPILTAEEFGATADAVYGAINARTDHALEGWEKLGFVAPQLRFTPDANSAWMTRDQIAKLPPQAQDALMATTTETLLRALPGLEQRIRQLESNASSWAAQAR